VSHTPASSTRDHTDTRRTEESHNGLATVAIVCGILGTIAGALSLMGLLPILMAIVGLVLGVAGLITGGQAWSAAKHDRTSNAAAIAGTLLSALAVILSVWSLVDIGTEMDRLDDAVTQLEQEAGDVAEGDVQLEDADPDEITD
jgi:uncharacterized membrane protein